MIELPLPPARPMPRVFAVCAVLYAGFAVTTPTGVGGAVDEATLLGEGATRGLTPPPSAGG